MLALPVWRESGRGLGGGDAIQLLQPPGGQNQLLCHHRGGGGASNTNKQTLTVTIARASGGDTRSHDRSQRQRDNPGSVRCEGEKQETLILSILMINTWNEQSCNITDNRPYCSSDSRVAYKGSNLA